MKRGIAKNVLRAALTTSCLHKMQASLLEQAERLKAECFAPEMVATVAESLAKELRTDHVHSSECQRQKVSVGALP